MAKQQRQRQRRLAAGSWQLGAVAAKADFGSGGGALDDVGVHELLQERHLAQRRARHALVLALELNLLERRHLAGLLVRGNIDLAKGALAKLLAALPQLE